MPDFPLPIKLVNQINIGTFSPESMAAPISSLGINLSNSFAWPTANLAIYIPVEIYQPVTIAKMAVCNGTAVSGNIDVGIYDVSQDNWITKGSTAQTGTSAIQIFDITDTLLNPGLHYMAVALDNTTATLMGYTGGVAPEIGAHGVFQQASAFPLPNPAVFAAFAQTVVPLIMMTPKVTI